jgi:hypothetical protein
MPTLTPELRDWLEQERTWGAHARHAISQLSRSAPPHPHGLERFRVRMALVDLTGSVAAWAKGLLDGLTRWGFDEAAAAFQTGPPFPATDLSAADYDRLKSNCQCAQFVLPVLPSPPVVPGQRHDGALRRRAGRRPPKRPGHPWNRPARPIARAHRCGLSC